MTLPGLPGAFLAGGTTASAVGPGWTGTVLGLAVVLAAVAAITFTAGVAADPEPVLSRSLFAKKNRSQALA